MRPEIESIIKSTLRSYILKERYNLQITQDKMAERLAMSTRSYSDIESGISCCGVVTALLFLMETEHREKIFSELKTKIERVTNFEELQY